MANKSPIFNKSDPAEYVHPDIERLYGNRYRVVRRLDSSNGASIAPRLTVDFATATNFEDNADTTDASLANLRNLYLIDARQGDRSDGSREKTLYAVYETLTNSLVKEVADVPDTELNGLKRVTSKLIGLHTANTDSLVVGTVMSGGEYDGLVIGKVEITKGNAWVRAEVVYLQPGLVGSKTSYKHGDSAAAKLTITRLTHFHSTPSSPGTGFALVDVEDTNSSGVPTKTYVYAKGSGLVTSRTQKRFGNQLLITRQVHLAALGGSGPVAIAGEYDRESEDVDGYTVWTLWGSTGGGQVSLKTSAGLNGLLTYSTQVWVEPASTVGIPAGAHLANEVFFDPQSEEGYSLYTSKGVTVNQTGDPLADPYIGDPSYTNIVGTVVKSMTKRRIDSAPEIGGDLPHAVIRSESPAEPHEGYTIYQTVWIGGEGDISAIVEPRGDGSSVLVLRSANAVYSVAGRAALSGTAATVYGLGHMIDQLPIQRDGWVEWQERYYSPPGTISYTDSITLHRPGLIGGGSEGVTPVREPLNIEHFTTVTVTFSVGAAPAKNAKAIIQGGVHIYESATYSDGMQPDTLGLPDYRSDYYSNADAFGGTDYRGRPVSTWHIYFNGQADQFTNDVGGVLYLPVDTVLDCEVEPYFVVGGVTCWKKTLVKAANPPA